MIPASCTLTNQILTFCLGSIVRGTPERVEQSAVVVRQSVSNERF